jgi:alkylated DNA nucleotide flippase Atl1
MPSGTPSFSGVTKQVGLEQRVIEAIRAIPEGFVRTYGDVSPGAPRFAGHVLKTVHPPDLPWWRVVRADGSLTSRPVRTSPPQLGWTRV